MTTLDKLDILKRTLTLRAVKKAYEISDAVTAGLGWGLALCAAASASDADLRVLPVTRREGTVIYVDFRRAAARAS